MDFGLRTGLAGECKDLVTADNIAPKYGNRTIDVYATPAMVGLMEEASSNVVDPLLPEGYATVGIEIEIKHLAATPVGFAVRAKAELVEIDGRRLVFQVEAFDEREKIGEGRHERFVVALDKFREKISRKKTQTL